jgi:hypothetical protein
VISKLVASVALIDVLLNVIVGYFSTSKKSGARIDRCGVDRDVDAARNPAVGGQRNRSRNRLERAAHLRKHEVPDAEVGGGMRRVDRVRARVGRCTHW